MDLENKYILYIYKENRIFELNNFFKVLNVILFFVIGQKRITFEEFIPLFNTQSKKKTSGTFEAFSEAFRIFDRDNNGMVSVAEVRHLLTSLGKL